MSDQTPRPPHDDDTAALGAASAAPADDDKPGFAPAPGTRGRWYSRRTPLLVTGAALLLGCLLGGAVVGVGALIADGHGGDDRGSHSSREDRSDGRGNDGGRHQGNRDNDDDQVTPAPPAPTGSAPATTVPTPTAST
jgi:hypothetical protein